MAQFQKTILDNGISVVTEDYPQSRAVACGVWVGSGTRDEEKAHMGVSHFLEHLVFKGTRNRNAFQLARVMEAVGGELNAHTAREYTCYHTFGLHEHLELGIDVLCDLVARPTIPPDEFERERQVVLAEIGSVHDNVDDWIYDLFYEKYYDGSPLAWPILGTEETIGNISRKDVLGFLKNKYQGGNIIVSAAGRLEHEKVVEYVQRGLGRLKPKFQANKRRKPRPKGFRVALEKDLEQVHILVGFPTTSFKDKRRFEAFIMNAFLGGGMTSKLYQRIREEKGLVYTIYSHLTTMTDSGMCNVYASTAPENARKVVELILEGIERLKMKAMSEAELTLFKTQVRGGLILGGEEIENRMNSLGVNEMIFRKYRPVDEVIAEVESVDLGAMKDYLKNELDMESVSILLTGPIRSADKRWLMNLGFQ